jgi:hypothetical protein
MLRSLTFSSCGRGCPNEERAGEGLTSAVKDPSSGSNFASLILATFSDKGRRKKNQR